MIWDVDGAAKIGRRRDRMGRDRTGWDWVGWDDMGRGRDGPIGKKQSVA